MKKLLLMLLILSNKIQIGYPCETPEIPSPEPSREEISTLEEQKLIFNASKPVIINLIQDIENDTDFAFLKEILIDTPELFLQFINGIDENGNLFLTQAIIENNPKKVQRLIELCAHINQQDKFGNTSLHNAILYGADEVIPLLIDAGADIKIKNKPGHGHNGRTAEEIIKYEETRVVFNQAVMQQSAKLKHKTQLLVTTENRDTLLMHAVRENNIRRVEKLIELGIDVNLQDNIDSISLQKFEEFKPKIVRAIKDGTDFEEVKRIKQSNPDLFLEFINNHRDSNKYTFLMQAILENDAHKAQRLIDLGCDINQRNCTGNDNAPLHSAVVRGGADKIIALLLHAGADVNQKNKFGNTPLHFAHKPKIISSLIAAGADITIKNSFGHTARTGFRISPESIAIFDQVVIEREKKLAAAIKIQASGRGFIDRQKVRDSR